MSEEGLPDVVVAGGRTPVNSEMPLSVVVPMFNEASSLPALADAVRGWFDPECTEFVFVDDGSVDRTAEGADGIAAFLPHAVVIRLGRNTGKGAAVRAGVAKATGSVVMFMDADLAVDLIDLDGLLAALSDAEVVIGSRSLPGASVVGASALRVVMGRTFSVIGRLVGRTGVRDSQCGFKAFRGEVATVLFGMSRVDGFAFDTEILYLARQLDLRVAEVPVTWVARPGSSVRPVRDSIRTLVDTVAMRLRSGRGRTRRRAIELGWAPRPHTDDHEVAGLDIDPDTGSSDSTRRVRSPSARG